MKDADELFEDIKTVQKRSVKFAIGLGLGLIVVAACVKLSLIAGVCFVVYKLLKHFGVL